MASWHELPSPKTATELGEYFSDYLAAVDAGKEEGCEPSYTREGEFEAYYVSDNWERRQSVVAAKSFIPKDDREDGGA